MKRKTLTILTIVSVLCMALSGCGNSTGKQTASDEAKKSDAISTEGTESPDGSETESTGEATDAAGEETPEEPSATPESQEKREPGLYLWDGTFVSWDDLAMDVEADYDNLSQDAKRPWQVFCVNDYGTTGTLVLPDGITRIGARSFGNSAIRNIVLPESLTSIGEAAFRGGGFVVNDDGTGIAFPDALTSIGKEAFFGNASLYCLELANTQITRIESLTFAGCGTIGKISFPDTLESIAGDAFEETSIDTSVDLSNTKITKIEDDTFLGSRFLTDITFPDALTELGSYALGYCERSLTSVDLSNTQLATIGNQAFWGCAVLTELTLPKTLSKMGSYLFNGCYALTDIRYAGTMEEWNAIEKDPDWIKVMSGYGMAVNVQTITCSDGVITLSSD